MQKCLRGLRSEIQATLSIICFKEQCEATDDSLLPCEPIIRRVFGFFFIAPEFPHMGHTVTVCFPHFLFFLYWTKWEQLCLLLLHIAQPPSPSGCG